MTMASHVGLGKVGRLVLGFCERALGVELAGEQTKRLVEQPLLGNRDKRIRRMEQGYDLEGGERL
jgi:hypothetical protein